jgi:hypothetical protein
MVYADDRCYMMLPTAQQEAVHKLETSARELNLKIDAEVLNTC